MIEPSRVDAGATIETDQGWQVGLVARLALLLNDPAVVSVSVSAGDDATVREFLAVVKAVAGEEQAMWLRSARLLGYAKTQDLGDAGYPSWPAFATEFSRWCGSRTRDYLRFQESQLDTIKEAVAYNVIVLTVAMRALRALGPEATSDAQLAFLAEATFAVTPRYHSAFMEV